MSNPLDTPRLQEWALGMAKHVAKISKDPSTQVGAVIFDPQRRIVSAGYNGLARGVNDTEERLSDRRLKYPMILHAEQNAILFASTGLCGCVMVVTHPCCAKCAAMAIQSGIARVMWPAPSQEFRERWEDELELTMMQFAEAGVNVEEIPCT